MGALCDEPPTRDVESRGSPPFGCRVDLTLPIFEGMNARTPPTDAVLRGPRQVRFFLLGCALAAVAIVLQGAAQQFVNRGAVSVEFLLRWRLCPVVLWAAITPFIFAVGRRWPFASRGWPVHLAIHGVLFGVWMNLSNALLRIPDLMVGEGAEFGREVMAAAIEYAPGGAILWIGLVLVGGGLNGAARRASSRSTSDEIPFSVEEGGVEHVSLREGYRTHIVPRRAVCWVEAEGDYLRVHTEGRSYRIRGPMKAFERELGGGRFLRIHRSTLVNVSFIREVQPYFHGDYVAIPRDGTELRIPRSRRAVIRRLRLGPREACAPDRPAAQSAPPVTDRL